MLAMLWLSLRNLARYKWMAWTLAVSISIPLMGYLVLNGTTSEISRRYGHLDETFLVVEQGGSMGEFYGSRLPEEMGMMLKEHGASLVEPEIRTVTGTTMENAMLLRGVTLETYRRVEPFRVIAGRPLEPGDPSRRVMVGERLAQERQAYPGGVLTIRGRDFQVQAVFSTGTYSDFEAWIALEDAQELLGWEGEVSIFIVPAGEGLRAGDILPEASVAVQMGESGTNLVAEFRQFFDLLGLIAVTLGISAAVILANALWRLAWQHRHDLAVLQAVGFTRRALCVYLGGQGAAITLVGFFLGILEGALVEAFTRFQAAEITIQPGLDGRTILLNFAFALGVLALSTALPVAWLARLNLTSLLHVE